MLSNFHLVKDHIGYTIRNKNKVVEASFTSLKENGDLRVEVVKLIFAANSNLRNNIKMINEGLGPRYKSHPTIQVEMKGDDLYNVFCQIGDERVVGTAISISDIQQSPNISVKFIELLFEDYIQLKSIVNALSELEENMVLHYAKK